MNVEAITLRVHPRRRGDYRRLARGHAFDGKA